VLVVEQLFRLETRTKKDVEISEERKRDGRWGPGHLGQTRRTSQTERKSELTF